MPTETLAIIDLGGGAIESEADIARIGAEIGHACREIGFFYLVNHGIQAELIRRTFAVSEAFFRQDSAEKSAAGLVRTGHNRGYVAMKSEALDPARGIDPKEAFNLGYESALDPEAPATETATEVNTWPTTSGFREALGAYYAACLGLGRRLHRAIANDLHLPADYFEPAFTRPMATLRLLHYPAHDGVPGELGAGEHTDYGNLTLLATDAVGGLEVRRRDGVWIAAPAIENALVVNIGDCLMRWTNDIYISTPHRVVAPRGRERYSIAFFLDPNGDALVEALPGTVRPGDNAKHPPITAGAHLFEKLKATYDARG